MSRTATSEEIKIIKINSDLFISANESNLEYYSNIQESYERKNSMLLGARTRVLIRIDHISHLENYKGTIRLIMQNGSCYIADNIDLELALIECGFGMAGN